MSDLHFREMLGVRAEATREEIRKAYRQRVMENHPDRFPPDRKALQELATVALTEAYQALMSRTAEKVEAAVPSAPGPVTAPPSAASETGALARPRDPAYAYYKQGFINFSLAIHGIAAVNKSLAAGRPMPSRRRFNTREYFGASLAYLRAAHRYFDRVVSDYADSVWTADARFKLRRIEGLAAVYRRILGNLKVR